MTAWDPADRAAVHPETDTLGLGQPGGVDNCPPTQTGTHFLHQRFYDWRTVFGERVSMASGTGIVLSAAILWRKP